VRREAQRAGHPPDETGVEGALFDRGQFCDGDVSLGGELFIGELQPALGFIDNIIEIVFEWNA
jgi:hypothetical protein